MISLSYMYDLVQVILGHFAEFSRTLVYRLDLWFYPNQKQPPEVFCKKRCSQKFRKIHRKTPVPESLFKIFLNFAKFLKHLFPRTRLGDCFFQMLFYCDLVYYRISLFSTFARLQWGRIDFFYSSGIVYPYLSIVIGKPFYVQCLFYCSAIVSSPLYR